MVDGPGEGRELTGGWQEWSQGKQQKLFWRREVTFSDSVAMEIERRQGLWFCAGLGLTVTLSTITGPVQSVLEKQQEHTQKSGDHSVQALTLLLITFVTMGK